MRGGELYRIKEQGKIAGVCAGVANYFGIETWLVRILTITSFLLLAPPFVVVGYIALWFILEEKSKAARTKSYKHSDVDSEVESGNASSYSGKGYANTQTNSGSKVEVKSKVWQAGVPPRQALMDIKQRYSNVEQKLRKLESYVTSKEFQLNREISRL